MLIRDTMRTPPEFHCHIQSLDSASTPEKFAQRELELESGYITATDHGTLEVTRTLYDMCAPGGKYHGKLKPILGLESYVRDDNCPILLKNNHIQTLDADGKKTFRDTFKYAHLTLHACDEKAYFKLVKKLSDADLRAEQHGSERKPLFDWAALEELGAENMTAGSSCLIGMVARHLMQNNDVRSAIDYYERLRGIFKPGNFYVELFPHTTDRYFQSAVYINLEDGTNISFGAKRKLKTAHEEIYAEDLASDFRKDARKARTKHVSVLDVMENRKWTGKQHLGIVSVELKEGFIENSCKPWCSHSDYQLEVNKFLYSLAKKYGDKVLVSGDAHFSHPEDHAIQDIRLNGWRFAESHHRMSGDESFAYFKNKLGVSPALFEEWTENGFEWASKFDNFKFSARNALPVSFYPKDTLRHTFDLIKTHGRMDWSNPVMAERLKTEINLLHKNGTIDLLPYFFVCEDVTNPYTKKGEIIGPGRGSAAGVLLAYLFGITHINPLKHNLSLDRFLTLDRIASGKLPDVDIDFPSRELLVGADEQSGFLRERFGNNQAQMSTDITLKLKSAIKDVHRFKDGSVSQAINKICSELPDSPQGINPKDFIFGYEVDGTEYPGLIETNKTLQDYTVAFPNHWKLVQGLLNLARSKSRHACSWIISDSPVDNFIPMTTIGGVRATAFTATAVEASGGLKVDLLVVNSVRDIGTAIRLIQDRHGGANWSELRSKTDIVQLLDTKNGKTPYGMCLPFKGELVDIWNLPQDKDVFIDICSGKVETVFQLDAPAARQGLRNFSIVDGQPTLNSVGDLAVFTALDRPGPLDAYVEDENGNKHNMLIEFARRARGEQPVGAIKILDEMLPETQGILVFQEGLQKVFQEVGGTTGIEANNFRQRIGKKKMAEVRKKDEPLFMKGATAKLGETEAKRLFGQMITFGAYGFCASHAISYMTTAYACAFLKHYYPLEWWTAVLSNADRNDVDEKFWRYCGRFVLMPDICKSTSQFQIEGDKIRAPVWLIHGIGEKAHNLLTSLQKTPFLDLEDFLTRLENYKKENATTSTRVDKKTGESIQTMRLGHNPINDNIIRKMIICGVMDSLFPANREDGLPSDTTDKLTLFDKVAAKVRNKKKIKPSATKFNLSSEVSRYQYIKSIMPAYSEAMIPMFSRHAPKKFERRSENMVYFVSETEDKFGLVTGAQFEWLENLEALPDSALEIALPAYVLSQNVFSYNKHGRENTACKLLLDIEGHRREFVRWPGKEGIPQIFKKELEGALVVCLLSRRSPTDSFFFQSLEVIAPPYKPEESSIND